MALPEKLVVRLQRFFASDLFGVSILLHPAPRMLGAKAFAFGRTVVIDPVQLHTDRHSGHRLLVHELTHVLQDRQRPKTPDCGAPAVYTHPVLEAQAERAADAFVGRSGPFAETLCAAEGSAVHTGVLVQCRWAEVDAANGQRGRWEAPALGGADDGPSGWYLSFSGGLFKHEATGAFYYENHGRLRPRGRTSARFAPTPATASFSLAQPHGAGRPAVFGLQTAPENYAVYDPADASTTATMAGGGGGGGGGASPSEKMILGMPEYVEVAGVKLYPAKYEFAKQPVHYHLEAPRDEIPRVSLLASQVLVQVETITVATLALTNVSGRIRDPDQSKVMGVHFGCTTLSANDCVGHFLGEEYKRKREWHWCHLIAHSLRSNAAAQVAENLVAGTAACNGDMIHIEQAVKNHVMKKKVTLKLRVEAHCYAADFKGTHIAQVIRYEVMNEEETKSCKLYFEPGTFSRSATFAFDEIVQRLETDLA